MPDCAAKLRKSNKGAQKINRVIFSKPDTVRAKWKRAWMKWAILSGLCWSTHTHTHVGSNQHWRDVNKHTQREILFLTLMEVNGAHWRHAATLLSLHCHYSYLPASKGGAEGKEEEERAVFSRARFSRYKRLMNHTYGALRVKCVSECAISRAQTVGEDKHVEVTTRSEPWWKSGKWQKDKWQEVPRREGGTSGRRGTDGL